MHTRIPELHGEDLTRSMGMFAVWWIETFFRVGRGGGVGLPEMFDLDEYVFMLHAYALTEWGRLRGRPRTLELQRPRPRLARAARRPAYAGSAGHRAQIADLHRH